MPELVSDVRSENDVAFTDIIAVDFGSVGVGCPLDELLCAVTDYPSRVRVVNPLQFSWRSGENLQADNLRAAAGGIVGRLGAAPVLIGQCSGAVFTAGLADVLTAAGRPPAAMVLVEPTPITTGMLADEAADLVRRLEGDQETARSVAAGLPCDGTDPERLSEYFDEQFRAVALRRVAGLGLDAETARTVVREIVGWYIDWLSFLAAQISAPVSAVGAPTHLVGDIPAEAMGWIQGFAPGARQAGPGEAASTVVARVVGSAVHRGDRP